MPCINTQREVINAVKLIHINKLDPKSLSKRDQNLIIEYLRYEEGWSQAKIAHLLNLVTDTVRARIRKIDEAFRNTLISRGVDAWAVITELMRVKRVVQTKAAQKGDWALVWKTESEYVAMLHTLGLIKPTDPKESINDVALEGMDAKALRELYEETKSAEQRPKPRAKAKIKA